MTTVQETAVAEARARKAHRLVAALVAAGATVDDLDLPDFPWDAAVAAAGVNPPSDLTKDLVRHLLGVLEAERHPADPFAGL